jgi:uncharacterized membrane protein HdeD (DUF308 family)
MDTDLKRSPWLTIEAIVLIILGVVALVLPLAAGIAVSVLFGLTLIVSGVVGLISAYAGRNHADSGLGFASAVIAIAVGAALLFYPLAGPVMLTILIGAYFLVDGVILIGMALDQRKRGARRWGWLMANGVLDIVLAAVLLLISAVGSAVLVGIFIGVDLILAGVSLLLIHRAAIRPVVGDAPPLPM